VETVKRIGVYGRCVVDGSILLTRLSATEPDRGRWTLPGGGMEAGESRRETLIREFREETGLAAVVGDLFDARTQIYPANSRRGALHATQYVYEVTATGHPVVTEVGGSTAEAAWIPLRRIERLPLVDLVRWVARL
jgi:8-oxo-dGTP diphosphatase